MNLKHILLIFTVITVISAVKKSYNGYKLFKVTPKDDTTVSLLKDVQKHGYGEFWEEHFAAGQDVKIMVAPEKAADFVKFVETNGIEYKEVIGDLQKAIDNQMTRATTTSSESYLSFSWTEFNDLNKIYAWLDELEQNHPGVVTTVNMGWSLLGDPIKGIVINYNPGGANRRIGVLEGTLHAREWISAATVTWIIKEFLTSTDPEIRALAENFEWHIFPVVNPDGYRYTFTDNRMWRKNRSPNSFTTCEHLQADNDMSNGVDLNRNFGFEWMTEGATDDACSNLFAGPAPFSEPETRAIRDYVLNLKEEGEIIYYIAFHSYTQLIVVPYSHVDSEQSLLSSNFADMYEVGIRGADALRRRFGTEYRVGLSANIMYKMSGTSFDWVKHAADVPMTYLIELRDLGEYGFLLPPSQIIPTGLETMDALVAMDKATRSLGYYYSGATGVYSTFTVVILGVLAVMFM